MSEKHVENQGKAYLQSLGAWVQKLQSGSVMVSHTGSQKNTRVKMAQRGSPDVVACLGGVFIGVEFKRDEKVRDQWLRYEEKVEQGRKVPPTIEAQVMQKKYIEDSGGVYILASCIEDIERALLEHHIIS